MLKKIFGNELLKLEKTEIGQLYHGSKSGIEFPVNPYYGRKACDFGQGFYLENNLNQVTTLVCDEKKPFLYTVNVDFEGLSCAHISGTLWALTVGANRGFLDDSEFLPLKKLILDGLKRCDVIIGKIADDDMVNNLGKFFDGSINDQALIKYLSCFDMGNQYVLKTHKACEQAEIVSERPLQGKELRDAIELSKKNRNRANALTKRIQRSQPPEGRNVFQILDEIMPLLKQHKKKGDRPCAR